MYFGLRISAVDQIRVTGLIFAQLLCNNVYLQYVKTGVNLTQLPGVFPHLVNKIDFVLEQNLLMPE